METIIIGIIVLAVVLIGGRSLYLTVTGKKKGCCAKKDCGSTDCGSGGC